MSPQQTAGLNLFEDFMDLCKMDKPSQQGGMGNKELTLLIKQ